MVKTVGFISGVSVGGFGICSDRDGLSMLLCNETEVAVRQNADGPT